MRDLAPPLILHLVHRFAIGGLENGIVNLINFLPPQRYRHAIVSLTDYTNFRQRIHRADVPVFALHKREGHDAGVYWRFLRVVRQLRPAILHTRNLPTLEFAVLAALLRVPRRIHGEHGRDVYDIDGANAKYRRFRQLAKPFVHQYIAVSEDLARWLTASIGVPASLVTQIYNGVDAQRFTPYPYPQTRRPIGPLGFMRADSFVIGTVGRMQQVKNQELLVSAFIRLLTLQPTLRERARLVVVGDGPLREECVRRLHQGGAAQLAWLPGERDDIPEILRAFDLFVLPSLAEGVSNTILEAMASGVAVVATKVGGNSELVREGKTGTLVPVADTEAMAHVLAAYMQRPEEARRQGDAGRQRIEVQFSMQAMTEKYLAVYDSLLKPMESFQSFSRQSSSVLDQG